MTTYLERASRAPLDLALERLRRDETDGGCAFDDLAAPDWAAFEGSRSRFLAGAAARAGSGRPSPQLTADRKIVASSDKEPAVQGVLRRLLLPPQPPAACVPRSALVGRVVESLEDRLVTVIAGAGYGKTTLLRLTVQPPYAPVGVVLL